MNTKIVLILSVALLIVMLKANSRPSHADLSKVDFLSECTTSSDPSNRLRYAHEDVVNSFLDVPRKFGRERMMVMHLGNDHLSSHGGTTTTPGQWQENGRLYKMQNDWGMIGDIVEDSPKVYFLKVTHLLGRKDDLVISKKEASPAPEALSEREVDPFETYAISLLKKGEPVVRWERDGFMRAVGAIRSSGACQRCHESKDGDLLGAFTYDFGKTMAPAMTPDQKRTVKYAGEGKDYTEIATILQSEKKTDMAKANVGPWITRQWLLDSGIVTAAMTKQQTEYRTHLLDWVQSSFNRPTKPTAKN